MSGTKHFILCSANAFEKTSNIDPARADLDWIDVTREETARITNNHEWQAVDNPAYATVVGTNAGAVESWHGVPNPAYGKVIGRKDVAVRTSMMEAVEPILEDIIDTREWLPVPALTGGGMGYEISEPVDIYDTRKRIIVPKEPDPPTEAEIEAARCAAVRTGIRAAYPIDTEIVLVNAAIAALSKGAELPPEYLEYRAAVAQINEETQ